MKNINSTVGEVTERIARRSGDGRKRYLENIRRQGGEWPKRHSLSCGNFAHGVAGCPIGAKNRLKTNDAPNLAIVSAYNDMLSAHAPYGDYPAQIKQIAGSLGAVAQVAGGTPAMCDGITQGQPGMDLSLFSRDVIALSTAIALAHNMFDCAVYLGICDKIVPGLLIGALSFGHLPALFIPSGPMPSGLSNKRKQEVRQLYAEGKATRQQLLEVEMASYHSPGTCTFYGTANSNQLLMEVMGLHVPGAAFINPGTPLRLALTRAAIKRAIEISVLSATPTPIAEVIGVKTIVNALVALLASGGSTNHTIHLIAIANVAGISINWDDFADLSKVTPLLARVYPNGPGDINEFRDAGGSAFIINELLNDGLLHDDVTTVWGKGLDAYRLQPELGRNGLVWRAPSKRDGASDIVAKADKPFARTGGLRVLDGELGRAIIKVSALSPSQYVIEAPALVFDSQAQFSDAFKNNALNRDMVVVLPFQGPKATGMPELHKLTPILGIIKQRGYKVALLTDGRMSGASGKIPAAIHLTPEAANGGAIGFIRDGDIIKIDAQEGRLEIKVSLATLMARSPNSANFADQQHQGFGRELFGGMRSLVCGAEHGASTFRFSWDET